jgi:hypothetical protein
MRFDFDGDSICSSSSSYDRENRPPAPLNTMHDDMVLKRPVADVKEYVTPSRCNKKGNGNILKFISERDRTVLVVEESYQLASKQLK